MRVAATPVVLQACAPGPLQFQLPEEVGFCARAASSPCPCLPAPRAQGLSELCCPGGLDSWEGNSECPSSHLQKGQFLVLAGTPSSSAMALRGDQLAWVRSEPEQRLLAPGPWHGLGLAPVSSPGSSLEQQSH